nr:SGNH/GDSL hydrolase family protein [uncultured Blautia sp.]
MDTPKIINVNNLPETEKVLSNKKMIFVDPENNSGGTIPFEKMRKQIADNATDPVARAQIANLAKLPAGSTTGDAELLDIRVGADGKTYETAGDAMREQIKNTKQAAEDATASLKDAIGDLKNKLLSVSTNHFDGTLVTGRVNGSNGIFDSTQTGCVTTEYIDCSNSRGDNIYVQYNAETLGASRIAFYDKNKVFVDCGNRYSITSVVTVPKDAYFVRVSWTTANQQAPYFVGFSTETKSHLDYEEYYEKINIDVPSKLSDLKDDIGMQTAKEDIEKLKNKKAVIDEGYIVPKMTSFFDTSTINLFDGVVENNVRVNGSNGSLEQIDGCITTGIVEVYKERGKYLFVQYNQNKLGASRIAFYDEEKNFVDCGNPNAVNSAIVIPNNAYYVRISWYTVNQKEPYFIGVSDVNIPIMEYSEYKSPKIPNKYLGDVPTNISDLKDDIGMRSLNNERSKIPVYLPTDIYVAVGRTIEIYNKQVCILADKYHFQWSCTNGTNYVGSALKRKFSIVGAESLVGDYTLSLRIYDDYLNLIAEKHSTLHIVADSMAIHSICNIGDSLSYKHCFYAELTRLSNNKLNFVGVIPYTWTFADGEYYEGNQSEKYPAGVVYTGGCEGRPGAGFMTYLDYMTGSTYSYDGVTGVPMLNPNTQEFDWNYYVTSTRYDPDIVQIFLGANGGDLEQISSANGIKRLVDKIRESKPNIKIMIVNTPYRADQNGIGYQKNVLGYATTGGMYKIYADYGVYNLMTRLSELFKDYKNLWIIPLALCFDSENNFGGLEVNVNPRSKVTEIIPADSIHPNPQSNYLQYADVMYSWYCGVLS